VFLFLIWALPCGSGYPLQVLNLLPLSLQQVSGLFTTILNAIGCKITNSFSKFNYKIQLQKSNYDCVL